MTAKGFAAFLDLPEQDRRDVFAATARRLDTVPEFVEKDFWVCLVLDVLQQHAREPPPDPLQGRHIAVQGFRPDPALFGGHRSRRSSRRPRLCRDARPGGCRQPLQQAPHGTVALSPAEWMSSELPPGPLAATRQRDPCPPEGGLSCQWRVMAPFRRRFVVGPGSAPVAAYASKVDRRCRSDAAGVPQRQTSPVAPTALPRARRP